MSAFDLEEKTIRYDHPTDKSKSWDDGEEVVIRELNYGEMVKLTDDMMADLSIGEAQDEDTRNKLKVGKLNMSKKQLDKMAKCIVSWTFTQNGKEMPINIDSLRGLGGSYGKYIMLQIEELNPTLDDEFQNEGDESSTDGEGKLPA